MQLNEIHTEHEHASVSLKVVLLIFAIILVGALGYMVWEYRTSPDTNDYSIPAIKNRTSTTPEPELIVFTAKHNVASWKEYSSSEYGFSFLYPPDYTVSDVAIAPEVSQPFMIDDNVDGTDTVLSIEIIKHNPNWSSHYNGGSSITDLVNRESASNGNQPAADVTIFGKAAKRIIVNISNPGDEYAIYYISLSSTATMVIQPDWQVATVNPIVDSILSTFKFTS